MRDGLEQGGISGEGRAPHLRLMRGGKARAIPAGFVYPRSVSFGFDAKSDARTREAVCEALRHSDQLDASSIDVYVANGEVTLIGMVGGLREEQLAVWLAEQCDGVRAAVSQLQLTGEVEDEVFPPVA